MRLAFLFPGQGSQVVGMGKSLADTHAVARATFEEADALLGQRLSTLCWEGPAEELKQTRNAQPALLCHSVALLRVMAKETPDLRPAWTAGHSLGEYSACVAAGALTFADALRLVRKRGELMFDAGRERPGTMAAVLGVDEAAAQRICDDAKDAGTLVPANLNAPGQIVLSGDRAAVETAATIAPRHGAKKYVMLEVSGAFHSPLMEPARRELATAIDVAPIRDPDCPVIANVTAEPLTSADAIRDALRRQLVSRVRWEDSMRRLIQDGAEGFLEIGPGRVLRGLLRGIDRGAAAWSVEDPQTLTAALAELSSRPMSRGSA